MRALGEHWLDATGPVVSGRPLEAVMIYGFWDGETIFVEPMVIHDLLLSQRNFEGRFGQPERVAEAVALPNAFSVSLDAGRGVHVVAIDALEDRVPGDETAASSTS
jgi:hypothetical protein